MYNLLVCLMRVIVPIYLFLIFAMHKRGYVRYLLLLLLGPAENCKRLKYANLAQCYNFVPFALETLGPGGQLMGDGHRRP